MPTAVVYALLYAFAFSHIYYYSDIGVLPLHSLFRIASRAHPLLLGAVLLPLSARIAFNPYSMAQGRFLPFCLLLLAVPLTATIAYYALTLHVHSHVDQSYIIRSVGALLRYGVFFAIGYHLRRILRNRQIVNTFLVFYILVIVHIFANIDPALPSMDFSHLSARPDYLRNYQFYADTFALFSLIVIASRARRAATTALVLVSTVCLFLLISRAAFYAYLMVSAYVLFDSYPRSWKRYVFPAAYLLVCYWALLSPAAFETQSRIATTFSGGLVSSASTLSRVLILQRGLDHLLTESWLFGDFRAHYKIFRQPGTYIHSYLSLWADYGIVPFAAFLFLLVAALLYVPKANQLRSRNPSDKPAADLYKYMLLLTTILAVGARSHFSPYIFLSFGLLFALREDKPPRSRPSLAPSPSRRVPVPLRDRDA